jgi:hypothetical protein
MGFEGLDELLGFPRGQFDILTSQEQEGDNVVVITEFHGTDMVITDKALVMVSRVFQQVVSHGRLRLEGSVVQEEHAHLRPTNSASQVPCLVKH